MMYKTLSNIGLSDFPVLVVSGVPDAFSIGSLRHRNLNGQFVDSQVPESEDEDSELVIVESDNEGDEHHTPPD